MSKRREEESSAASGANGPRHGQRDPLTKKRVIEAALRVLDAEGLESVTMRRVGRELGVEAMSLYNHVEDKDAILAGLCEAVLAEFEIPEGEGGLTERLRAMARAFRALLLRHPNAISLFSELRTPVTAPEALMPIEVALGTLRGAGLSEEAAVHAYRVLVGYVMGYVGQECGGLFAEPRGPGGVTAVRDAIDAGRLPNLAELLPCMLGCDPDEDFEVGLDIILSGLETRLRPRGKQRSAAR